MQYDLFYKTDDSDLLVEFKPSLHCKKQLVEQLTLKKVEYFKVRSKKKFVSRTQPKEIANFLNLKYIIDGYENESKEINREEI